MIRLARVSVRVLMDVPSPLVVVAEVLVLVQSLPDESSNIPALFAAEVIHAPHSVCAKDDAPLNMCFMSVTLDTSHLEMSQLNDDAEKNIPNISVTLDTSHLEMSPLNAASGTSHASNNLFILVTAETSQDPIGPCGPLEQLVGDMWRHCTRAAFNPALDDGAHPVVVHCVRQALCDTVMIRIARFR